MPSHGPILVVDDDEGILGFIQMALEEEGYRVLIAEHGAAALDAVRQENPGLILLDLRMSVMDGSEFMRAYQEMPGPHAPIVLMTAGSEDRAVARELGAIAHLSKPFELVDLFRLVERLTA